MCTLMLHDFGISTSRFFHNLQTSIVLLILFDVSLIIIRAISGSRKDQIHYRAKVKSRTHISSTCPHVWFGAGIVGLGAIDWQRHKYEIQHNAKLQSLAWTFSTDPNHGVSAQRQFEVSVFSQWSAAGHTPQRNRLASVWQLFYGDAIV